MLLRPSKTSPPARRNRPSRQLWAAGARSQPRTTESLSIGSRWRARQRLTDPAEHRPTRSDLLVVAANYAPEDTGVALVTTAMAEQLALRTSSVTVLTGLPHHPNWQVDPRYQAVRRLVQHPPNGCGPVLIRVGHHIPSRRAGWGWARYEASFYRKVLAFRPPRRPDLVIGILPTPGGAAAAARLARRHAAEFLLVVHDLIPVPPDRAPVPSRGGSSELPAVDDSAADDSAADDPIAVWLVRRMERSALERADRIVVTSPELAAQVAGRGIPADRIQVIEDLVAADLRDPRVAEPSRQPVSG